VPVWHEATKQWVEQGRLVLLGITEEQHADRCRLFAQWKGFDWPILYDPINVMQSQAVPIVVAIDEHGIVRSTRPRVETFEEEFLDKQFEDDAPGEAPLALRNPIPPSFRSLRRRAELHDAARDWRALGDALAVWGGTEQIDAAIAAYKRAAELEPEHGDTLFRLGVCYRMRYESRRQHAGDFQAAVDFWGQALEVNPNQYIWRRRIQQYGPRLDKPYAFYDWVSQAVAEITERGEKPLPLAVEPSGAEIAQPSRRFLASAEPLRSPDPEGRIRRDEQGLIQIEPTVVPSRVRPGETARVHLTLRPNDALQAHWNNEVEPLRVWIEAPTGWQLARQLLTAPQPKQAETSEVRRVEFELQVPAMAEGNARLKGYALYYVCEDVDGVCLFLRQDVEIPVTIAGNGSR
jgi:hypothetical protein